MATFPGVQVDVEVSDLLRNHVVPEACPDYLLSFSTPICALASVSFLGESPELPEQLFKDAEITALPKILATRAFFREAHARYTATLVIVRTPSRARDTPLDLHQPRRQKRVLDSDTESDVDPDVRRSLLDEFPERFGFHIPVFPQASDRMIKKLARRHRKKMVSSISFAEISTAADLRMPDQEVKMDKNKKLVVHDQRKRGKFNASSHSFLNALETLLLNSCLCSLPPLSVWGSSHPFVGTSLFQWVILATKSGFR